MLATVETHFIISDALRFMFSRLISQQDKVAFCNSADILPTYPLTHHTYQHTPQSLVSTHFGTISSVTCIDRQSSRAKNLRLETQADTGTP